MTDDQAVPQARERAYQDWWCNALEPWLDDPARTRDVSHEAFCAGWDGGRSEAVHRHVAEQEAVHADLGQLLELLSLGNYARPQSPHEVFQMCLARLRDLSHAEYRNPDGSYHTSPPVAGDPDTPGGAS